MHQATIKRHEPPIHTYTKQSNTPHTPTTTPLHPILTYTTRSTQTYIVHTTHTVTHTITPSPQQSLTPHPLTLHNPKPHLKPRLHSPQSTHTRILRAGSRVHYRPPLSRDLRVPAPSAAVVHNFRSEWAKSRLTAQAETPAEQLAEQLTAEQLVCQRHCQAHHRAPTCHSPCTNGSQG